MGMRTNIFPFLIILANLIVLICGASSSSSSSSAVGDPGMRRDGLRVAFEGWNFCNEVGQEAPAMGSPRAADCFDLSNSSLIHKVKEADNKLGVGQLFPGLDPKALNNPDLYAVEKERYLGTLCEVSDTPQPWQFWMVMLKNGNYDAKSRLCPRNGNGTMRGGFNGTYELNSKAGAGISYFEIVWEKKVGIGSWVFTHKLRTSKKYPWLMMYLRADATKGYSGGYHYDTRGMLKTLPESPNFKVRMSLDIKQGGGPNSQFYLIDIGSCWKNNGAPCDGDVLTDVTRYSEMIINPDTRAWCGPRSLINCPPYHVTPNNTKILRNDTANFPYGAYHYYCAPGNAQHLERPYSLCDPYSNPQAQELLQLLPHPIWAEYGYPAKQGDGWIGNGLTWELDVGALSCRLYFYQDPGSTPARRIWTSLDVGTEIFVSDKDEVAEWTLSDFDVILT